MKHSKSLNMQHFLLICLLFLLLYPIYPFVSSSAQPDLTITYVSASPSTVFSGGKITVSWTEYNKVSANAPEYHLRVCLATTQWGTDYGLYVFYRAGLEAGKKQSYSESLTVWDSYHYQWNIPPGEYYVTVYIDSRGEVSESDENNNIGSTTPNKVRVILTNIFFSTLIPLMLVQLLSAARIAGAGLPYTKTVS